ncbi:hypothetical protein EVAR_20793_1 [Eumeta japonica]|uniref:Uncharacterized protein n=1 Tax=Eumeta variegata TaxID=151549 RepID=A0A4C1UDP8_EUMVA|nr:hypothetical protein EVAR_20793_1 [Eumeta japonica]
MAIPGSDDALKTAAHSRPPVTESIVGLLTAVQFNSSNSELCPAVGFQRLTRSRRLPTSASDKHLYKAVIHAADPFSIMTLASPEKAEIRAEYQRTKRAARRARKRAPVHTRAPAHTRARDPS